ncbi:hypothetical protein DSC45_21355 [Streptomyces sp. YIM 130001]|uniref:hypothetical protein n=1 Tax=Streptomyces sp. YIM 130001 TaxID=2259644 RepID=UPI000E6488BF|nr:hypothetical protein [Streptomyces sp. YIM 130001]RII14238.1 hypothetical protein DSC45_21355 [Streptomyces sp. YIM 130001]
MHATLRSLRSTAVAGTALLALLAAASAPGLASGAGDSGASDTAAASAGAGGRPELPARIDGGAWPTSHVQGVTVDRERGFVYWSFTQMLVKTDLDGKVVGTVEGLTGHLGDIDRNDRDGRVYGSLEYKAEESFYIAVFDVDRIDRVGMNAETDGVMTAVHLNEVAEDFTADMDGDGVFDGDVADTADHRYGCSGIDGVSFGPEFGRRGGEQQLKVAYGVYSHTGRTDNDHQVILAYDTADWRKYERPLSQSTPHHSGPKRHDGKYFVRTGNTTYGVQNLQYDPYTENWIMAVYQGEKEGFPNYSFFTVDGTERPVRGEITGQPEPETGKLLELREAGLRDEATGIRGWEFHGSLGFDALGDGRYYVAEGRAVEEDGVEKQHGEVRLHRWTGRTPTPFEPLG